MADRDDELVAVGLQKLLYTLDGVAVIIEQVLMPFRRSTSSGR